MTLGALPHMVEARTLAAREVTVEGTLQAARMPRLDAAIVAAVAPARVHAQFCRDEEGRYILKLSVHMAVSVACQRCLGPLELDLVSDSQLAALWTDEQAQQLPSRYDPLITGDETDLWQVVEDELLLALPAFSYHSDSQCGLATGVAQPDAAEPDETDAPARDNPFTVLAALKNEPSERS